MNRKIFDIAECIFANLSGDTHKEEQQELDEWQKQSQKNKDLFEQLEKTSFYNSKMERYKQFDKYYNFKHVKRVLRRRKQLRWIKYGAVAATLLLPLFILFFLLPNRDASVPVVITDANLLPGQSKATLILSDGSSRELTTGAFSLSMDGVQAINYANNLTYNGVSSIKIQTTEEYNTVIIPRGGEYQLILSDGTKIWMNSESSIHFPVQFKGAERCITISGEAYLEVAEDKNHPFIVKTDYFAVRVLGTSFNVRAYRDENVISTTLVKGKIRIDVPDGRQFLVLPSEQLTYNEKLGVYEIRQVDTDLYTSWKDGVYLFEQQSLEKVLETISRWYDLTIFYRDDSVKQISFSGRIKRYDCAEKLLQLFEQLGGVKFIVKNRTVTVEKE